MKEYLYRNKKTNQEVKRKVHSEEVHNDLVNQGYSLLKVIDYTVSESEKNAK